MKREIKFWCEVVEEKVVMQITYLGIIILLILLSPILLWAQYGPSE